MAQHNLKIAKYIKQEESKSKEVRSLRKKNNNKVTNWFKKISRLEKRIIRRKCRKTAKYILKYIRKTVDSLINFHHSRRKDVQHVKNKRSWTCKVVLNNFPRFIGSLSYTSKWNKSSWPTSKIVQFQKKNLEIQTIYIYYLWRIMIRKWLNFSGKITYIDDFITLILCK